MSFGFFLDFDITLPTESWIELQSITGGTLPAGWWGFGNADTEQLFTGTAFDDMTFERTFGIFEHGHNCTKIIESTGGTTRVRFCMLLDKTDESQSAKVYAAFAEAAAKQGATGYIQLVNDGSSEREAGVKLTLQSGAVSREAIEDGMEIMEELAARALGEDSDGDGARRASEQEPDPVREPAPKAKTKAKAKAKLETKPTAKAKATKSKAKPKSKPKSAVKTTPKAKPKQKAKPTRRAKKKRR